MLYPWKDLIYLLKLIPQIMGLKSVSIISNSKEKERFVKYLLNDIKALEFMIDKDMIEKGIQRIGAEQDKGRWKQSA